MTEEYWDFGFTAEEAPAGCQRKTLLNRWKTLETLVDAVFPAGHVDQILFKPHTGPITTRYTKTEHQPLLDSGALGNLPPLRVSTRDQWVHTWFTVEVPPDCLRETLNVDNEVQDWRQMVEVVEEYVVVWTGTAITHSIDQRPNIPT